MRKIVVLAAMLAMMLVVSAPAMAQKSDGESSDDGGKTGTISAEALGAEGMGKDSYEIKNIQDLAAVEDIVSDADSFEDNVNFRVIANLISDSITDDSGDDSNKFLPLLLLAGEDGGFGNGFGGGSTGNSGLLLSLFTGALGD